MSFGKSARTFPLLLAVFGFILMMIMLSGCEEKKSKPGVPGQADFRRDDVVLETSDGINIHGTFVHPADENEVIGYVLLFHQYKATRDSYSQFQDVLAESGIVSLAIDFRGFGASTENGLSYKNFADSDYQDMLMDIEAAIGYIHYTYGSVKIGIVGASIGANLAIMTGASYPELRSIVALSPGRDWHGLKPLDYASDVDVPVTIVYSRDDKESAGVAPDLLKRLGGESDRTSILGNEHGTNMLDLELSNALKLFIIDKFQDVEPIATDDQ